MATDEYAHAVAIQRAHESDLLALPGVTGVAVKLRGDALALVVDVDPDADVPEALLGDSIDDLPLVIERARYLPL